MGIGARKRPEVPEDVPEELQCLVGPLGPYRKSDKAEFHNLNREVQEWLIRLDPEELVIIRLGLRFVSWARSAAKWARRIFWAFTAGLSAVLLAGERLAKLPETISGAISGVSAAFKIAKTWWGI